MNLYYLKSFCITVKNNSISKAAKTLHLTQPGLSLQLQSLEKDLGVSLLTRSNKGIELTEAGQILYDYANTILSLKENLERDISNIKEEKNSLLVGSCKAVGEYALPCSIYTFKQENGNVDIQLEIINTQNVVDFLENRNINLGITSDKPNSKALNFKKITSDRLLLVTSLPLKKNKITLDELKTLPLILREKGSGTRAYIEKKLLQHSISYCDLKVIYELNSMEAIKTSLISGKGISFIPEMSIKRELKEGLLKALEIEDINFEIEYFLCHLSDYKFGPPELAFEEFIMSSKRGFC